MPLVDRTRHIYYTLPSAFGTILSSRRPVNYYYFIISVPLRHFPLLYNMYVPRSSIQESYIYIILYNMLYSCRRRHSVKVSFVSVGALPTLLEYITFGNRTCDKSVVLFFPHICTYYHVDGGPSIG